MRFSTWAVNCITCVLRAINVTGSKTISRAFLGLIFLGCAMSASGHDLSQANANYVQSIEGTATTIFTYLGAKHMFTGFDHILFLTGVMFFLRRARDIAIYASLFTVGHSITLLSGVLANWMVSASIVDAIIGFSVVYKGFENLGGIKILGRWAPDTRIAVFVFGLFHGLGLATKLQGLISTENGGLINLICFNVGVELGQLAALVCVMGVLVLWRLRPGFDRISFFANSALMVSGFMLAGFHLLQYSVST